MSTLKSFLNITTDSYIPFSKCFGQYIAELSTWLAVTSILAAFDVSL